MRILFVSSEAFPIIKTGGLADVAGSLCTALQQLGADVRLLIPGYSQAFQQLVNLKLLTELKWLPAVGNVTLILGELPKSGLKVIVVACAPLYERSGSPYVDHSGKEWPDNPVRFATLSRVAAILGNQARPVTDWVPDIVHCNDWQSGLTPALLHYDGEPRARSLFCIHNLSFQGTYDPAWVAKLGVPARYYQMHGLEYYGHLSFLKAGLFYADCITTVSPTYAVEIQTPEYGCGMQDLLQERQDHLYGILNGIDTEQWNPATDVHLPLHYQLRTLGKKQELKKHLQQRLGLTLNADAPLLGVVSRLTHQKGLDLFVEHIETLITVKHCQIAVLGSGDAWLESQFKKLAKQYPQHMQVTIGYDEPLAHQIMAGVDLFIMPSRFEPCGLNQMYGLRYGTPPLVRNTGGLADTVVNVSEATLKNKTANGFVFDAANSQELADAIDQALACFADKKTWQQVQKNGMSATLGWERSAQSYLALYQRLLQK